MITEDNTELTKLTTKRVISKSFIKAQSNT